MKKFIPILMIVAAALTAIAITTQATADGLLTKEPPEVIINGPPINFTADKQDIDIQIDPNDALPFNGTVSIPTTGATDSDMNGFPPLGTSVIIQNDTVTVTNHPVTIGSPAAAAPASSSSSSSGDGDEDGE